MINNGFIVGDKLVIKDVKNNNTEIFEVSIIGATGGLYDSKWRLIHTEFFRKASEEELAVGHRLTIATT